MISLTIFNDPACPWGYSASPAIKVLEWRYGDQLERRLVLIGLTEHAAQYHERGYTPALMARGQLMFRDRYGMPFSLAVKRRVSGTARACRAVVAARLLRAGSEWAAFRSIQLANFTTAMLLDDDEYLHGALAGSGGLPPAEGVDADEVLALIDSPEVTEAYERDRAEARTADGSPTEAQGKAADTDGRVRYTAPSLRFQGPSGTLEAGGFQPLEAYDVVLANLDPGLERRPAPEDPAPLLAHFPDGLTTQEVAALMASGNTPPDRGAAEACLLSLAAEGRATRLAIGDDALWLAGDAARLTPGRRRLTRAAAG